MTKIMAAPKKYIQDHVVLLLLSANIFLAVSTVIFVLLRLSAGHGSGYIAQYRPSVGVDSFKPGSVVDLLSFIIFAFLVLAIHTILSIRCYAINRHLTIAILGLGILFLLLTIIVSNALLVLH